MNKKIFILIILVIFIFIGINFFQDEKISGNDMVNISEQIIIPVKAHTVVDPSGVYTSSRNEENILSLLEKANQIWKQANIYFQLEEIVITNVSSGAIPDTINGNYFELLNHKNFAEEKINLFLVQNLKGINGLALVNINSVLVSDYTTVNDFRTTAHEIGHVLDLKHVSPPNRLLARGKNGELLSTEEILIARNNAERLF